MILFEINWQSYQLALAYENFVKLNIPDGQSLLEDYTSKRLQSRVSKFMKAEESESLKGIFTEKYQRMMFWKQIRAARRIRDLVNLFGEKILLINYKDDDNIFKVYTKKFRQTIPQAEWNEFLTELKQGKGEVTGIFNEKDKSISELFSKPMGSPETVSSSTTASSPDPDKRYTDIDIDDPLRLAADSLQKVIVLNCLYQITSKWDKQVTNDTNMIIAPRLRENHWVCYAAKKKKSGMNGAGILPIPGDQN